MPSLVWGVLVLVAVPLLQVPAVLYLSRYVELEEGERVRAPADTYVTYPCAVEPADPDDVSGARDGACPQCGADNDPEYDYCRLCAGQLT